MSEMTQPKRRRKRSSKDPAGWAKEGLDWLPLPVILMDGDGNVIYLNRRAEAILEAESASRGICRDSLPCWFESLRLATVSRAKKVQEAQGRPSSSEGGHEAVWITVEGGEGRYRWTGVPIGAGEGALGTLYVLEDMAELQRVQADLEAQERLCTAGELASRLVHEVKNGLSVMKGIAQMVSDCQEPKRKEGLLRLLHSEIDHQDDLISDYLAFCSPAKAETEIVDVAKLLEDTISLMKEVARGKGIQIVGDVSKGLPRLRLSSSQMKRVFLNLIKNALEAMPPGGTLQVGLQLRDSQLEISFHDTGPGIPPGVLRKMFTPFYSTKPGGTGLGLVVSLSTVQSYGGHILVETRQGHGSRFTLLFPVTPADSKDSPPQSHSL